MTATRSSADSDANVHRNESPGAPSSPPPEGIGPEPAQASAAPGSRALSGLVDAAAICVLGALALFGFSTTYGGSRYLVAGVVGLLLGAGVSLWGARRGRSAAVVASAGIATFFLFGSIVALPNPELGGLVPTPANLVDLADGAVQGWKRLITMQPPVGSGWNLLVVPYLCGLTCSLIGVSVALRSRRPMWAALPPCLLLVLSILLGTEQPASTLLQGGLFAVVLVAWWSHVHRERRRVDVGSSVGGRWWSALAVLVLAGVGAMLLGPVTPGAESHDRVVLRDHTEPPFDPADHPSPLNGYRRFTNGPYFAGESEAGKAPVGPAATGWRTTELFRVSGLPSDQRLRLATLDAYDGSVFDVAPGSSSSGHFEHVGSVLPASPSEDGRATSEETVTIEVLQGDDHGAYQDIWLPMPERAQSITFDAGSEQRLLELQSELHLNPATGTAAMAGRLLPGDRYEVVADVPAFRPDEETLAAWRAAGSGKGTAASQYPIEAVQSQASQFVSGTLCPDSSGDGAADAPAGSTTSAYERAEAIAAELVRCGAFSDGNGIGDESRPGHSVWRLDGMLATDGGGRTEAAGLIGNGEQYGALAALVADALSVPSRVVMGFRSLDESEAWREAHGVSAKAVDDEGDRLLTGSDVTAWIEVELESVGWVPVWDVVPDQIKPILRPEPDPPTPQNQPPPPPPSIPPSDEEVADADRSDRRDTTEDGGFILPGWVLRAAGAVLLPVLVIGAVTGLISWLKSRRRERRRTRGTSDERIAGGWDEVIDLAADLGNPVPALATRHEQANFVADEHVVTLAGRADALVFGPTDIASNLVEQYWHEVDAARSSMTSNVSRFGRWKALVNLASFRPARRDATSYAARDDALPDPAAVEH